ncbi:MAG: hypothetical protein C0596_03570 [Marinilabiliales bacterium]|nr:MAG: hypothetical protein C0596_03570 [Marinilabiliales bacterium]
MKTLLTTLLVIVTFFSINAQENSLTITTDYTEYNEWNAITEERVAVSGKEENCTFYVTNEELVHKTSDTKTTYTLGDLYRDEESGVIEGYAEWESEDSFYVIIKSDYVIFISLNEDSDNQSFWYRISEMKD